MTKTILKPKTETFDATGIPLGRLASRAAVTLRGKNLPGFTPHLNHLVTVKIVNAQKVTLTGNKLAGKTYFHHSGYPGNQKITTAGQVLAKKGAAELIRRAVRGMLPPNRLRAKLLKRLIITN